jgi:hypothetical protein
MAGASANLVASAMAAASAAKMPACQSVMAYMESWYEGKSAVSRENIYVKMQRHALWRLWRNMRKR